jgi:hypothetical protein
MGELAISKVSMQRMRDEFLNGELILTLCYEAQVLTQRWVR